MYLGQDAPTLAEPWIQTPGFLQDRANRLHAAMLDFNNLVGQLVTAKRLATDSGKYRQWKNFINGFGAWYKDASWLWSATAATLESYEKDFQGWVRWARQTFPESAQDLPTAPTPFSPDGQPRDGVSPFLMAAAFGAGVFVLYKLTR